MFSWIDFLIYSATGAITPGPNNIMSMSGANQVGVRRNLPFNFGVFVGFVIVATLSTAAMSALNAVVPAIEKYMKIVGAAYLLYLAYKIATSDPNIEVRSAHTGFWTAVALQFINPKLYTNCIGSMGIYILPYYAGQPAALFGFVVVMASLAFVSTLLWACFGSGFRKLLARRARPVYLLMALLLVYCAVSLFL